jgi:ankyrin repeat protein
MLKHLTPKSRHAIKSKHVVKPKMQCIVPKEEIGEISKYCPNLPDFEKIYAKFKGRHNHLIRCVIMSMYNGWLIEYIKVYLLTHEDISYVDEKGWNALHYSCFFLCGEYCVELVRILLQATIFAGCNIDSKTKDTGMTVLHLCGLTMRDAYGFEVFELLLNEGANVNSINRKKWNLLHMFANSATSCTQEFYDLRFSAIKRLIDAEIDLNLVDGDGKTPLHLLLERGEKAIILEIISLLVSNGALIDIRDNWGITAYRMLEKIGIDIQIERVEE